MRHLEEILLPIDFSPRCADVARYAAAVARRFRSGIKLLHAIPPLEPTFAFMGSGVAVQEALARQEEDIRKQLNVFAADELGDLSVERAVCDGDPAEVIASYCAAERVGLIMMPTSGCNTFRHFLLGSVTAKVLHDVACPVWTTAHVRGGNSPSFRIPEVIVCATDLASENEAILRWTIELAATLNARLIVAHAIPCLEFHPETHYLEADRRRALIGNAHAKIWNVLDSSAFPAAEVVVKGGSVSTVVRNVLEANRADLLVIGRASRTEVLGRLRTHSYALIRESPCPVISI